jgi:bifunctional non-homologous end joining protein LigD
MAFDVMYLDGSDLTELPLWKRRLRLENVVAGNRVFPVRRLAADGLQAWRQVLGRGYEGYVPKDDTSPYVSGRTRVWLK